MAPKTNSEMRGKILAYFQCDLSQAEIAGRVEVDISNLKKYF